MDRFQEVAQINFTDKKERFTRIIEHKHLTGQVNNSTSISYEYPTFDGEPYYPIPSSQTDLVYRKYLAETKKIEDVLFIERLGEYKYYNMDGVVARILKLVK